MLKNTTANDVNISMQANAEIKTSMSCNLPFDPDINLLSDRLRPYQIINGTEYPMGEYVIATAPKHRNATSRRYDIEAYDLGHVVMQTRAETRLSFAAGTKYLDAVKQLLVTCGIDRLVATPTALTFAAAREDWEIGTSYLTIINVLLTEMGYNTLWFDRNGFARVEPKIREKTPIIYMPDEYSVISPDTTTTTDIFDAYNVFTVVVSSPDIPPMVATAVNDSPLSPISTVNRGRRICAPVQYVDGIASQEQLNEYAENIRYASMQGTETISFSTLPIPTHQVEERVILESGIYDETGWDITLGFGGTYTHTAKKVVQL
ncbi:MAG: hypothetical protein RSF82_12405 [Angelakisella sp.]